MSVEDLSNACLQLEAQGAHNINLVTATHHAPHAAAAIRRARKAGLSIPVVYNTSGYERAEMVAALAEVVDIWLVDIKYADSELAERYSHASDYPHVASSALQQMWLNIKAAGGCRSDSNGLMQQGIIVRHLVLPEAIENACAVLTMIYEICGNQVDVSVMNQYTPTARANAFGTPLNRPITPEEYEQVLDYADTFDFQHLWWQEGGTVSESFVPAWDEMET